MKRYDCVGCPQSSSLGLQIAPNALANTHAAARMRGEMPALEDVPRTGGLQNAARHAGPILQFLAIGCLQGLVDPARADAPADLVAYLDPQNRRVAAPISDKIYLMREVKCPAVLVECGFLSNESECTKLKDGGYQTKLAAVIIALATQLSSPWMPPSQRRAIAESPNTPVG